MKRNGFSLLEMSIVLVIAGVFIATLVPVYNAYEVKESVSETKEVTTKNMAQIGNFRAVKGRYPCPAPFTAEPGDMEYGHEQADCRADTFAPDGTCNNGVCTSYRPGPDDEVLIGSLPFKALGMEEEDSYDAYGRRLTYAVTQALSEDGGLESGKPGVISVVKENGDTATQSDAVHFVVLSHGSNGLGGYSREGNLYSPCVGGLDDENCDLDFTFRSQKASADFDDRLLYFSPVEMAYWEMTADGSNDIRLRGGENISVGYKPSEDLPAEDELAAVKANPAFDDSGSVLAEGGVTMSNSLCNFDGTDEGNSEDCFKTKVIMGYPDVDEDDAFFGGMKCPKDSDPNDAIYMIGIEHGEPICTDEVFMSCPTDSFISGMAEIGDGIMVKCTDNSGDPCKFKLVDTSCGQKRLLKRATNGTVSPAYSGKCYKFNQDYDAAYWANFFSIPGNDFAAAQAQVASINAQARNESQCGNNPEPSQPDSALVRDVFTCTNGTWIRQDALTVPKKAHERTYGYSYFPNDFFSTAGDWPADISPADNYTYEVGEDVPNTSTTHDCWCREDYKAQMVTCGSGYTGNKYIITKHACPQTYHAWTTVYIYSENCSCQDGPRNLSQSCASYYNVTSDKISGNVTYKRDYSCAAGGYSGPGYAYDTSQCTCPGYDPKYQYTNCPVGWGNKFNHPETGAPLEDIAKIEKQTWSCPSGPNNPGEWSSWSDVAGVPACTCGDKKIVTEACEAGLDGTGVRYEVEFDCGTGDWEDKSLWTEISRDCKTCSWQNPGGAGELSENRAEKRVGSTCSCGSTPKSCYDDGPDNMFYIWGGCQCAKHD